MSSPLKRLMGAAGARVAILPVTALASIAISHIVSNQYSVVVYATFILAYTIPALLPSFDFGFGAPVTTATARIAERRAEFKWIFLRSTRALASIAVAVVVLAVVLTFSFGIGAVLGVADRSYDSAFLVAAIIIAGTIAVGLGPALMLGLQRNGLLTILQGTSGPLTLCVVLTLVWLGAPAWWAVALAPLGLFLSNAMILGFAVAEPRIRRAFNGPSVRGPFAATALPMLIILIATPLAIQSGRVALSWTTDLTTVAAYAAAFTLFGPAYSVGQIAGRSLWPEFIGLADQPAELRKLFLRSLALCTAIGGVVALSFLIVAPTATQIIFPSDLHVSPATWLWMALTIVVISVHQPSAMLLTNSSGLRAQATCSVLLAIVVILGTLYLAREALDAAPVISLAAGFVVVQFLPVLVMAMRRLRA